MRSKEYLHSVATTYIDQRVVISLHAPLGVLTWVDLAINFVQVIFQGQLQSIAWKVDNGHMRSQKLQILGIPC